MRAPLPYQQSLYFAITSLNSRPRARANYRIGFPFACVAGRG